VNIVRTMFSKEKAAVLGVETVDVCLYATEDL
jgi:hypothetical protein